VDEGVYRSKRYFHIDRIVRDPSVDALACALQELERYFAGEPVAFRCPLDLRGTAFQVKVWQEMCNIAHGQTRSYGKMAQAIGHPQASRAVGAASGANPVAIIVPCHRVIGSNGTLTGYGGGLSTKAWLLALEGVKARS
jgi:O-6-methylguanine DNA methyltransferase